MLLKDSNAGVRARRVLVTLMAAAGLVSSAAFAQTVGKAPPANAAWNGVVAAAKQERSVNVYLSIVPPVLDRLLASFKTLYPEITVEYFRAGSGQVSARVDQERGSGSDGADVVITSEFAWFAARSKEAQIIKPIGPSSKDWPQQFTVGDSIIGGLEPFVMAYNKTLVATPPKTYADMLRPEYKGKVGTTELTATTIVAWYEWLEKTQGADFLVKLKGQAPKLYVGAAPISQSLTSGEIAIGAYSLPTAIRPLTEKGAPIDYVVPVPSFGVGYSVAAMSQSRRPNAALVFVDFLMSAEGQTAWHGKGESASPRPNIKGSLPLNAISLWPWDKFPPEAVKTYTERWNKVMK
jgi:iron(III) transport system substrate-binding protein